MNITATVSSVPPGSGTPTGMVTFEGVSKSGPFVLGTRPLDSAGQASLLIAAGLDAGDKFMFAVYGGDPTFAGSTSPTFRQEVDRADTNTVITPLQSGLVFGQLARFEVDVNVVPPGRGFPSGLVGFSADGFTAERLLPNPNFFTTPPVRVGELTVSAGYSPDQHSVHDFNNSGSSILLTVNKDDTVISVASVPNPSVFGQLVTFTAIVTAAAPGSGTPTGTVTFMDGATTLGTSILNKGKATFSTSRLEVGTDSITLSYSGDGNFNSGVSTALTQTVNRADSAVTLISSVNPSVFGQSVTFRAKVSAVFPGSGTPTGTVSFLDGGTTLATVPLTPGGSPSFTTTALAVGNHTITASYGGDGNFNTGASAALTQTVNLPGSSTAVPSPTNPLTFGQSPTLTATIGLIASPANKSAEVGLGRDGSSRAAATYVASFVQRPSKGPMPVITVSHLKTRLDGTGFPGLDPRSLDRLFSDVIGVPH